VVPGVPAGDLGRLATGRIDYVQVALLVVEPSAIVEFVGESGVVPHVAGGRLAVGGAAAGGAEHLAPVGAPLAPAGPVGETGEPARLAPREVEEIELRAARGVVPRHRSGPGEGQDLAVGAPPRRRRRETARRERPARG